MRGSVRKLLGLAAAFLVVFALLVGFLGYTMVGQHERWQVRSDRNRWTFRDTPTQRGTLWDRFGEQKLAVDVPDFELMVHYQLFRRRHPVGCALHGAALLAEAAFASDPSEPRTTYRYDSQRRRGEEGVRDPRYGFGLLMNLPVHVLLDSEWIDDDDLRRDLAFYITSALASLSGESLGAIRRDLRAGYGQEANMTVADAVCATRPGFEPLVEFDGIWSELSRLDLVLVGDEPSAQPSTEGARGPSVLSVLDEWRRESDLERARLREWSEREGRSVGWGAESSAEDSDDGESDDRPRDPREEMLRRVAKGLPFDLAGALRTEGGRHPGVTARAAVRREHPGPPSLRSLIGSVKDMSWRLAALGAADASGKATDAAGTTDANKAAATPLSAERAEGIVNRVGVEQLVPDGDWFSESFVGKLREEVVDVLRRSLLHKGRKGISGVERELDEVLSGRPGLRLVERDRFAREQFLASHMNLTPGRDARLTLDLQLQARAEGVARTTYEKMVAKIEDDYDREELSDHRSKALHYLETALVVMDAETGDLLAMAGWPLEKPPRFDSDTATKWPRGPAGVNWHGAGHIGSLIKPLVVLEYLANVESLPRRESEYELCARLFKAVKGQTCSEAHGDTSRSHTKALIHSCNIWFYELSLDIGSRGIEHAVQRFGLAPLTQSRMAGGGMVVAANAVGAAGRQLSFGPLPPGSWCPDIVGLGRIVAEPRHDSRRRNVLVRSIGYETEASPVHVARAYAALATGALPTPSLVLGPPRARVELDCNASHLDVVRGALRKVVEEGSARREPRLRRPGMRGKTGTATLSDQGDNNAWFAGWLDPALEDLPPLVFVAVGYWVPQGNYGGAVGGAMVGELLDDMASDPVLQERYRVPPR